MSRTITANRIQARPGFSLVELLTVLAVTSIMAAIAIPSFGNLIRNNRLDSESHALLGLLLLGRSEAAKRVQSVIACKSSDGTTCSNASGDHWGQGIIVFVDTNDVSKPDARTPGNSMPATSRDALAKLVLKKKGWKRILQTNGGLPAERSLNRIALLGGTLFATTFTPDDTDRENGGTSRLYCLDYKTGLTGTGTSPCNSSSAITETAVINEEALELGPGRAGEPMLLIQRTSTSGLSVLTHSVIGTVNQISTRTDQNIKSGEIDWRELKR